VGCGRRNKITVNREGIAMYGDYCSYDCCLAAGACPSRTGSRMEVAAPVRGRSASFSLVGASSSAGAAPCRAREGPSAEGG
jgi:hypothetical protein